jgi:hypothetical protein
MANVDSPFGLRPVGDVSGRPWNGTARAYSTASGDGTAIFLGDPVKLSGTSQTINGRVYLDVDQAATGDVCVGVVVAVDPVLGAGANGRDSTIHRAASTVRILYVCDDPNALFEIQEVSGGTALTANDAGLNADFVVAAGSATTGQSGVELNNVGEATTNTLDLKIVGLVSREDNEIGEHAKWLVRINRHQFANQVAGI